MRFKGKILLDHPAECRRAATGRFIKLPRRQTTPSEVTRRTALDMGKTDRESNRFSFQKQRRTCSCPFLLYSQEHSLTKHFVMRPSMLLVGYVCSCQKVLWKVQCKWHFRMSQFCSMLMHQCQKTLFFTQSIRFEVVFPFHASFVVWISNFDGPSD